MSRRLSQLAALPVTELKGVGDARAKALAKVGIATVLDLLTYYPRRYIDRTNQARLADLDVGEEATVLVKVVHTTARRTRNGKSLVTSDVSDGSGHLRLTFFNQPFRERQLKAGTDVVLFGRTEVFQGRRQMTNPVVDLIGDRTGRIVPVYPQSEKAGVMSWDIARFVEETLRRAGEFADPLDEPMRRRFGFVDRTVAFHDIHAPESMKAAADARRRLVFDELLRVQVELVQRKRELERTAVGVTHVVGPGEAGGPLVERFRDRLPYDLTGAQQRTLGEILDDLGRGHPMHRLLQGDVGAGKTVVAVSALLAAVQGGHQGALMAPTEVLAEQHHLGIRQLLDGFTVPDTDDDSLFGGAGLDRPLRVVLLTNRTPAGERRRLLADLAAGSVDLVIGTHALISDGIEFQSLGVVVIDEQHRFGVEQRAALRAKGRGGAVPDVLVMTATPIPRTAAMTVYGDLDVSVLDELPPGRTPIVTRWARSELDEAEVWEQVRAEVAAGRQAYVVCPLIDESEKLEARSAEETHAELTAGELSGLRVGLLHGRVPAADKDTVMEAFRRGELDVLVATTVIEVGVDVPNATVMVILDAARFGIAQLHQLRGRVGRGADASQCWLVGEATTPDGEARLEALVRSTDGFELAEVDLDLRGEGTIMGERQKGQNDLKLASLRRDREWVVKAREVAVELVDADPGLDRHWLLGEEVELLLGDDDAEFLLKG
ncbi:ATP-dependent DNA helicase RecG [Rhabdothermincola salaria]|uniref:ATP-dependent DNA helicase RecG n=1 Tax=Rhabdothermincola salaria TaxID=2903142 RepID=UPI001E2E89D5|nr:ATP-dependent DNA helicase RecG [Rhabdothermincola salaria]MCD9624970.1 ATP-dependent DNA helicase RecG [Rhabdothermincola salaria]